ncbi:MAG: HupE/UreJ family protein [Jannaschia sp.]
MKRLLSAAALATMASPAMAHHPLGGLPMETFAHGLASGIGHPVLGFDHLFFVLAMGIAASFTARRATAPFAYVAAMLAGCALAISGLTLPAAEAMIVLSLLVVGFAVARGRALSGNTALVLFAGFGLFHGAAFAGALTGQEGGASVAVLAGYLIGLAAIQYALALAAGYAARGLLGGTASTINARLAGAMVAGIGVFLGLEMAEGPILTLVTG